MRILLDALPVVACGALMCVPMTIGRWLRRRRGAPGSPAASAPKALAGLLRR
jgi:hypothetical protein